MWDEYLGFVDCFCVVVDGFGFYCLLGGEGRLRLGVVLELCWMEWMRCLLRMCWWILRRGMECFRGRKMLRFWRRWV